MYALKILFSIFSLQFQIVSNTIRMYALKTLFSKCNEVIWVVSNSLRLHALPCFQNCLCSSKISFQIASECTIWPSIFSKLSDGLVHYPTPRSPTRPVQQQWWSWWSSSGPPSPDIISGEAELLMATVRFALVSVCYISEEHARLSDPLHHRDTLGEGTIFSLLCMCPLSLLWPERSRAKITWPGLSRRWYASFSCLGLSALLMMVVFSR